MEYLDLSVYEYRKFPLPMRSVGWLGPRFGLQGDGAPPLSPADTQLLRAFSRRLGSVTLGTHPCDFCPAESPFEGNGEYRYYSPDGDVYCAPMMVLHYVEEHGYRPPAEFVESLRKNGPLDWDTRAQRLRDILLDDTADFDFRCEAAIDLVHWRDRRAVDALMRAVEDEELVDGAGDEIGRSLVFLQSHGCIEELRADAFPEFVRIGIAQALRS